jgi:hypothetical protein
MIVYQNKEEIWNIKIISEWIPWDDFYLGETKKWFEIIKVNIFEIGLFIQKGNIILSDKRKNKIEFSPANRRKSSVKCVEKGIRWSVEKVHLITGKVHLITEKVRWIMENMLTWKNSSISERSKINSIT